MPVPAIECPSCKTVFAVGEFLEACSDFWPALDTVRFMCSACRESTDARIEDVRVSLGYVYAAGGPHFCGMVDVPIDGLVVSREGVNLVAKLENGRWTIPARVTK